MDTSFVNLGNKYSSFIARISMCLHSQNVSYKQKIPNQAQSCSSVQLMEEQEIPHQVDKLNTQVVVKLTLGQQGHKLRG